MRTLAALGAIVLLVVTSFARAQDGLTQPNIVILLADDLGSADLGWRGGEVKTPYLDALAEAGAKLDALYAMPVCSPTRAALLTGRYPFRYGLQTSVVKPWASYGLPTDERTLADALKDAGYETAIVGKWHLGHAKPEYLPTRRGFDHQYGHYNGALDHFTHIRDGGHDWHRDDFPNYDDGYTTELQAREAVVRIEHRDESKPLFLYVPFTAAHGPYQVPPRYADRYAAVQRPRRKLYMGMVAAMDEAVGQIWAALRRQGIDGNTIVIFASDNGGPQPGVVTRNGDLREGKGTLYEGGVRVVGSVTWPGVIPLGSTVKAPLHMVDFYPTILRAAGASLDQPKPIDGRDVRAILSGEAQAEEREIIINVAPNSGAIRRVDWKLVINGHIHIAEEASDAVAGRDRRMTYALYDMKSDRQERHDVADQHPEVVAALRARYEELARSAATPFGEARDPAFRSPKIWGQTDATSAPSR